MRTVPFNRPSVFQTGYTYLHEAVANMHLSGDGPFTRKCHALLENILGVPKVLLTTSCTHALEMAALLLDVRPGDEVIVPSYTFVSTVNAFVLRGAKPIFADVRPDTLNIDESKLASLCTDKTKAVVVVHYAGVACEMDVICRICSERNIPVVEDNAHGLLGKYRGRYLGTFGCLATQSFHETKNFSCGEGGALIINDPQYIERAEMIREKGTNRTKFFQGLVDKYTWVEIGSSFLPSDALAALLLAQLEQRDRIQEKRRDLWNTYAECLDDWAKKNGVGLPVVPDYCEQPYHLFYMLTPTGEHRRQLMEHLKERGISTVFHYLPLHTSPMGRQFDGQTSECPVTESISDRLLRLPLYYELSEIDQRRVINGIFEADGIFCDDKIASSLVPKRKSA